MDLLVLTIEGAIDGHSPGQSQMAQDYRQGLVQPILYDTDETSVGLVVDSSACTFQQMMDVDWHRNVDASNIILRSQVVTKC